MFSQKILQATVEAMVIVKWNRMNYVYKYFLLCDETHFPTFYPLCDATIKNIKYVFNFHNFCTVCTHFSYLFIATLYAGGGSEKMTQIPTSGVFIFTHPATKYLVPSSALQFTQDILVQLPLPQ